MKKVKEEKAISKDSDKIRKLKWFLGKLGKSIGGLYLIGVIIRLNDFFMMTISPLMFDFTQTKFMSAELVSWANYIVEPARIMFNFIPWFIPVTATVLLLIKGLSMLKFISKKELKIFTVTTFIIFLLMI